MKVRISIMVSAELLRGVDSYAKQQKRTRSGVIEEALRALLKQQARDERNARDREILDRNAHFLNQEAADVLKYQRL
jgi:metal-responsive CopG/Arc/MetJ family transcriptional regulator